MNILWTMTSVEIRWSFIRMSSFFLVFPLRLLYLIAKVINLISRGFQNITLLLTNNRALETIVSGIENYRVVLISGTQDG